MTTTFEYGIAFDRTPDELHRGPMSKHEALEWIREWEEMAENERARRGMFVVIRRPVGEWETC